MESREFEVFKGNPESKPFRLGAVRGSQRAVELMYRMYARLPGNYFVRDLASHQIVASLRGKADAPLAAANFDIFRGVPERDAVCIDTADALPEAQERMEQMANCESAAFFVFSRFDRSILTFAGCSRA